jgi:hypothetical protein
MAHYKNIVRSHDDFELTLTEDGKPVHVFVLDEREKFDVAEGTSVRTLKGPRIIMLACDGSVTDCKIRDKDFWGKISKLCNPAKPKRRKKQTETTVTAVTERTYAEVNREIVEEGKAHRNKREGGDELETTPQL